MAAKRPCQGTVTNVKAHNFGNQCQRFAINGSEYCNVHGGNLKHKAGHRESLERRCIARNRRGEQCGKAPILGAVVCKTHGAGNRFVRAKAQARLASFVDPALTVLHDLMIKPSTSDSDRARLALAILDRSGLGPGARIEVGVDAPIWEGILTGIIKQMPDEPDAPSLGELPWIDSGDGEQQVEDAVVVMGDEPEPRDYLPRIVPPQGAHERATIRRSSEPPPHLS